MTRSAQPTVIGAFVLGAVVLCVATVLAVGGGRFFREETVFVVYFDRSVRGLDVGAPVSFRGVRVGTVERVRARFDTTTHEIRIPVYIALERGAVEPDGPMPEEADMNAAIQTLILEKGLRAQLLMDSFITGKLYIGLDYLPGTTAKFYDIYNTPEIPTAPTDLDELTSKVETLPIDRLFERAIGAFSAVEETFRAPELRELIRSSEELSRDLSRLSRVLERDVPPLSKAWTELAVDGKKLIDESRELVNNDLPQMVGSVEGQIGPLAERVEKALIRAETAFASVEDTFSPRSALRLQLADITEQLVDTLRTIRSLVDYLEQHPESILRGKQ